MDSSHLVKDVVRTFLVTADKTEGCQRQGFTGMYKLQVGFGVVQLLQPDSDREITHWPLSGIRNFGFSPETFFLHAGSRCSTGEGKFKFFTLEGEKITHFLSIQVNQIQNQLKKKDEKSGKVGEGHVNEEQKRSNNSAAKTISKQSQSGQASHSGADSQYTEPVNFSLLSYTKIIQAGSGKINEPRYKELKKAEGSAHIFPPSQEQEEDYYNSDLYSHLDRDGSHLPENEYGISSASAKISFSEEEIYENTANSTYEYEIVS